MNAPRPANATSISDADAARLRRVCDALASEFGVIAIPARIWGPRWAAIPGLAPAELPVARSERFPLGGSLGLILYGLSELPPDRAAACRQRVAAWPHDLSLREPEVK